MGVDPVSMGLSGVSTIGNMVGGKNAQNQQANAQNAQNQISQQELQQEQQLIAPYLQQVVPGVKSLLSSLNSGSNPYANSVSNSANALSNYGNSAMNQQLANWNGLKPQELSALTTNAANSGMSDINTARSTGAFGANQNAAIGNALQQNRQGADQAAVNIGANASQQEVGALESANNASLSGLEQGGALNQSLLNTILSGNSSLLGLLSPSQGSGNLGALSQLSGSYGTAAGQSNPFGPASTSLGQFGSQLQTSLNGKNSTSNTPAPISIIPGTETGGKDNSAGTAGGG